MIQPKNETENLLLSITKNCETLVQQTHRKPEETLEFKMLKSRETFHFKPPIQTKGDWMIGLIDLEIYNSIFNITEVNNKFELYTDTFDEFSFPELKDEIGEILNIPNITDDHLDDKATADRIAETYWKLRSDKITHDGFMILLTGYAKSLFRDFETYLRIAVGLEENNIRLILKQYNEKFITYALEPGNYNIQDIHKTLSSLDDHKENIQIDYDEINKKVKLILTSANSFGTLRFDDKSFFHTLFGFDPYWDYKPTIAIHADLPGIYTNDKDILNLNSINKIHLKCDAIDGSIQDGVRQPILFSFALDKPSGYKIFCEPETIHYKKINKSVLNTISFSLQDDNNEEVDFNGETLTFTLQMIKI